MWNNSVLSMLDQTDESWPIKERPVECRCDFNQNAICFWLLYNLKEKRKAIADVHRQKKKQTNKKPVPLQNSGILHPNCQYRDYHQAV